MVSCLVRFLPNVTARLFHRDKSVSCSKNTPLTLLSNFPIQSTNYQADDT
jgi:hypothetical protein